MAKGRKGFAKGESGNLAGKPKGTPTKKTIAWENLGDFLTETGALKAKEIMMSSAPKEFMLYYSTLLEYFKPKQQRVENNISTNDDKIEIKRTVIIKSVGN
jgi:hypothetical protein